jgi:DNA-binding response OmpR family regulator
MKERILVVDDDESVRDSLRKVLEGAGYEVALAGGGLEAAFRFAAEPVDLLVLDLALPNQSGWDVFGDLTTRRPAVPVIIITGLANQRLTAEMAGAGALFEKPIDPAAFLERIAELLAEPPQRRLQRMCGIVRDTRCVRNAREPGSVPQTEHAADAVGDDIGEGSKVKRKGGGGSCKG